MEIRVRPQTELKNLLKIAGWVQTGGEAKASVKEGLVLLNGAVEVRPSKKLFDGDIVEFRGEKATVIVDDHS